MRNILCAFRAYSKAQRQICCLFACCARGSFHMNPFSFPLSLYFSYLDAPLPANPPRVFHLLRAPPLSLSLFPPSLSFTIVSILICTPVFYFHSVPLIRPDFSPLYTFFNAHFRLYGHFPALLFVSSFASSPSFTFVPFFPPPPSLSFLSFPFESNFSLSTLEFYRYVSYVFSKKKIDN